MNFNFNDQQNQEDPFQQKNLKNFQKEFMMKPDDFAKPHPQANQDFE